MSKEKVETSKTKRVPDLDADDTMARVQIMLPHKWIKKLSQIAVDRECSKGSLVREALRDYFRRIEEPTEPNPDAKINDEELNKIFENCTAFWGMFEIEEEDEGFIRMMRDNDFKLKDLTAEQWERVQEKILIGYKGYMFPPNREEFAEKFEPLEPSEEQRAWLLGEETE